MLQLSHTHFFKISLVTLLLAACSSNPPAPVIDRLPSQSATSKPSASKSALNKPTYKAGDWRPDTYIVKKGDTLFSIGLEHGYYYKEIAQANNIAAPYTIKVGQTLKFSALKDKPIVAENKAEQTNSDGVTTYALNTETNATSTASATNIALATNTVAVLKEPKSIREPYSEEALKTPLPASKVNTESTIVSSTEKPVTATSRTITEPKPEVKAQPKPDTKNNTESPEDLDWAWPTKGKVIANFNDAGNKGIDISGNTGQSVEAAAAGKVIYSGSDLRGYGKLVIIKHNSAYLSVYAHNNQILVKEGQQVSRGQKIAEMGSTDSSTVKLHFEIRRQGKSVDPSKYLSASI